MIVSGTRLGPYEILAPLGAGGMGEVYRARDTRLGRDVAIKVLPPQFVAHADRRGRFENEARAASALNHPNVLHIYDFGRDQSTYYIAMELVDGRTLREVLAAGPMPLKKILDVAAPVADGLAKAHAAGIIHRDLKPDNIMISRDGFAKILDFGLAKLAESLAEGDDASTRVQLTESGMLLGTVGYMSAEQAAGRAVDFRSDQFSLGTILYEMVTRKRPFARPTLAQTLAAIIESDPEPVASINPAVPFALQRIIERCLSKEPQDRYASTADLARDLRDLREHGFETTSARTRLEGERSRATVRKTNRNAILLASFGAIAVLALAWLAFRVLSRKPEVHFARLSFRRGIIWNARFTSDGQTFVYGGAWGGKPFDVLTSRLGQPESRSLGIEDADVLSVSSSGSLALGLHSRFFQSFQTRGTLATVPLGGGVPRPLLDDVQWADYSPDGRNLAIVREWQGRTQLEYPIGKVLYQSGGWIGNPRVSPDGRHIAFIDHPVDHDPSGFLAIVDTNGKTTTLAGLVDVEGLAWTPDGREIWFTGSRRGVPDSILAVTLDGRERLVMEFPAHVRLQDIDSRGTVLLVRDEMTFTLSAHAPGAAGDRDLSFFDISVPRDISADGRTILMLAQAEGAKSVGVYLRPIDGSPAVWLGDGVPTDLAPDGSWAIAFVPGAPPAQLWSLPTGTGQPRPLTSDSLVHSWANIFPDGKRILFLGAEAGHGRRLYVREVAGGPSRPISPEGADVQWHAISPDGSRVAAYGPDQRITLYPVEPGAAPVRTPLTADDEPIDWTADGKSLYVFRRGEVPARIYRANVETGEKALWREVLPADTTGLESVLRFQVTPDERAYAYSSAIRLSTLYVVTGLR